ncbi:unnamed protein product [Protopolystoma xenopodis]|uniref:Uncharacterized protein n=1 Tax=Protopolystoma xenopodis TaxID=117903 RepID=A0A3S5AG48_9PLAT|nr:unnamed protein product [Protopolystoma xenopodis]
MAQPDWNLINSLIPFDRLVANFRRIQRQHTASISVVSTTGRSAYVAAVSTGCQNSKKRGAGMLNEVAYVGISEEGHRESLLNVLAGQYSSNAFLKEGLKKLGITITR